MTLNRDNESTLTNSSIRKKYTIPTLTTLGKVAQLTAGGSGTLNECENPDEPQSCNNIPTFNDNRP